MTKQQRAEFDAAREHAIRYCAGKPGEPFRRLALALRGLVENDYSYEWRYHATFAVLDEAVFLGLEAGIRLDPEQPEWPVVFIELPGAGQVSWHIPQHEKPWDGHTTEDKYTRIQTFCGAVGPDFVPTVPDNPPLEQQQHERKERDA